MKKLALLLGFVSLFVNISCGLSEKNNETVAQIETEFGTIKIKLYNETPLHRDNFIKLVNEGFYTDLLFHRVIKGFMIQGGDPNSKKAKPDERLGGGGGNMERIPAEFRPELFHKKGALAAARDGNPEKKSSACQFYIVQEKVYNDSELDVQLKRMAGTRMANPAQREIYKTIGGTPHLDGNYTVFGEVISGMAVLDSIARQPKDGSDRPLKDIRMSMSVEKIKKKKITKKYGYRFE